LSNRNWNKASKRDRMHHHGAEERDSPANLAPVPERTTGRSCRRRNLRWQADALLAGYTGAGNEASNRHICNRITLWKLFLDSVEAERDIQQRPLKP
jgi:hypothetical protein